MTWQESSRGLRLVAGIALLVFAILLGSGTLALTAMVRAFALASWPWRS